MVVHYDRLALDKHSDVQRIESSRNLSVIASLEKRCNSLQTNGGHGISFHASL